VSDLCVHFGECGGCQTQDVPYLVQLEMKQTALRELFETYWRPEIPVEASPAIWHYRNKVDPAFGRRYYDTPPPEGFVRESVLGFKRKGRWFWPLDVEECRIGPEGLGALLESVRGWMRRTGLQAFDSRTHEGFLKTLLVREGKRTGDRMVALITAPGDFVGRGEFIEAVQAAFPVTSLYRGIHSGSADVALADEIEVLEGAPTIEERLDIQDGETVRPLRFRLSPFSFFQTNTLAAERLYGLARCWVSERTPDVLLDLYCGMGGFALSCADLVGEVWAAEGVFSATEDGQYNARLNGVTNVSFFTDKIKNYLLTLLSEGGLPENCAAIVDPSRSGMTPKALRRLVSLAPANILYVSCNAKELARELPELLNVYELRDLRAVDLFPHTRHVEVVAWLSRREPVAAG